MSYAPISVICIKNGRVTNVGNFDFSELDAALNNFQFHVEINAHEIMIGKDNISRIDVEKFCDELYDDSDDYPCVYWGENNSIQMVLEI